MSKDKDKQNEKNLKDEFLEDFGQRLKEVRQLLKLLQKDFAASLEVSGSFLSEIEKGKANPGFDVLTKIYLNYDINLHYLIDGRGEPFVSKMGTVSQVESSILSGPDREKMEELLYYIEKAPVVRYAVYEFFSNYLYKNKGMIEEDMQKHRDYLQKTDRINSSQT